MMRKCALEGCDVVFEPSKYCPKHHVYCSRNCSEKDWRQIRRHPLAKRKCKLDGCKVEFVPKRKNSWYCSGLHRRKDEQKRRYQDPMRAQRRKEQHAKWVSEHLWSVRRHRRNSRLREPEKNNKCNLDRKIRSRAERDTALMREAIESILKESDE